MRRSRFRLCAFVLALAFAFFPSGVVSAASHAVEVTSPDAGDRVTDTVPVEATTTGAVTGVDFEWSPDGGSWQTIGPATFDGTVWTASWNTGNHSGPAAVRAVATDGATDATDQVQLVVDNQAPTVSLAVTPDPFSPNGDGRLDSTAIRVRPNERSDLVIRALDSSGTVRRRWDRSAEAAETVSIRWRGTTRAGRRLPDGGYTIEARATDQVGLTGSAGESVAIDRVAPRIRWRAVDPEPLRGQRHIRFRVGIRDRLAKLRVIATVSDRTGRVGRARKTVYPGRRTIRWRARYSAGGRLFPGQYRTGIKVRDNAGNITRSGAKRWRTLRDVRARVFRRVRGAGKQVALTFDDCHQEGAWRSILRTLRRKRADATFFCPGQMMKAHPGLLRRTDREGHVIGSHGWDHAFLTNISYSGVVRRLKDDSRTAWRIARQTTASYFRPPYGAYDGTVLRAGQVTSHARVIIWDVDTGDWRRPGSAAIRRRAVAGARRGSIVLMHTLDQTASALPGIIRGLRRKGLQPVTLAHLFRGAGMRSG